MNGMRKLTVGAVVALAVGGAACGGAKPGPTGQSTLSPQAPMCTANGATLQISASHSAFDRDCLAAPAGTAFSVVFLNHDPYSHDFAVFRDADHTDLVYRGEGFKGPEVTQTFQIAAMPPGTYYFRCDYHLLMTGTLEVSGPSS